MKKNIVKEKPFKFTGKNASKYNNKDSLDYLNDIAKESGLKLGYTEDGFGAKLNALIKKDAKANKNGVYSHKDSIGNWSDAQQCSTFLNGFYAGKQSKKLAKKPINKKASCKTTKKNK